MRNDVKSKTDLNSEASTNWLKTARLCLRTRVNRFSVVKIQAWSEC